MPWSSANDINPARNPGRTKVKVCNSQYLSCCEFAKLVLRQRFQNVVGETIVPLLRCRTIVGILQKIRHAETPWLLNHLLPPLPTCVQLVGHLRDGRTSHGLAHGQRGNRTTAYPEAWRNYRHPNASPSKNRISSKISGYAASTCLEGSMPWATSTSIMHQDGWLLLVQYLLAVSCAD